MIMILYVVYVLVGLTAISPTLLRISLIQWYTSLESVFFSVRLCVYSLNHMSELAQVWRQDADTIHYQSYQNICSEIMCVPQLWAVMAG